MPVKIAPFLIVATLGLLFGFGIYFMKPQLHSVSPPRHPAAQWAGKHSSPFQIQITAPRGLPPHEGADVELLAQVKIQQSFNNDIEFNWILPPGVNLVEGDQQDSISGVEVGQSFERKLVINGLSKTDESQVVVLQVFTEDGGTRIGSAGIFKAHAGPEVAAGVAKKVSPDLRNIQQ